MRVEIEVDDSRPELRDFIPIAYRLPKKGEWTQNSQRNNGNAYIAPHDYLTDSQIILVPRTPPVVMPEGRRCRIEGRSEEYVAFPSRVVRLGGVVDTYRLYRIPDGVPHYHCWDEEELEFLDGPTQTQEVRKYPKSWVGAKVRQDEWGTQFLWFDRPDSEVTLVGCFHCFRYPFPPGVHSITITEEMTE